MTTLLAGRPQVDTLYISLNYPEIDLWNRYYQYVPNAVEMVIYEDGERHDIKAPSLDELPHAGEVTPTGHLIKRAPHFFKMQVQKNGVTMLLWNTNNPASVMFKFDAAWCLKHLLWGNLEAFTLAIYGAMRDFGIDDPGAFDIKIKRLDLALDVFNFEISTLERLVYHNDHDLWVSRSKRDRHYPDESVAFGSRESAVFLRCYDKILEATKGNDIEMWQSAWGKEFVALSEADPAQQVPVMRMEYEIKPQLFGWEDFLTLDQFTWPKVYSLLEKLLTEWGRIVQPNETDSNRRRWSLHPVWQSLVSCWRRFLGSYIVEVARSFHLKPTINRMYLLQARGWLAGMRARIGFALGRDRPATVQEVEWYMSKYRVDPDDVGPRSVQLHDRYKAQWPSMWGSYYTARDRRVLDGRLRPIGGLS